LKGAFGFVLTVALTVVIALLSVKVVELDLTTLAIIVRNGLIFALIVICMVYFASTFILGKLKVSKAYVGWTTSFVFAIAVILQTIAITSSLEEAPFFLISTMIFVDRAWGVSDMLRNKKSKTIVEK